MAHSLSSDDSSQEEPFHTVYFSCIPLEYVRGAKKTIESIYGGAIQRIRIHNHNSSKILKKYGFVTFESPEVAARALTTKRNWPNGHSINIKKADEWHQSVVSTIKPTDKLSPEACQTSHFDALNSDCLIYLYTYLHPIDIANASEAIQSLSQFAEENIYHKYTTMNFFACKKYPSKEYSFKTLQLLLKHFGEHVTHCAISASQFKNPTIAHVRAVLQYCPNLVQIRIEQFSFGKHALKSLCNEELQPSEALFINCSGMHESWSRLWTKWIKLRSLTIHGLISINIERMLHTLVNLEKLSLADCLDTEQVSLAGVVGRNPLISLSLVDIHNMPLDAYSTLVQIAPNLTHLKAHIRSQASIDELHGLKHLKHLQIIVKPYFSTGNWTLRGLDTLEELDIVLCASDLIAAVSNVPSLRVLSIRNPDLRNFDVLFETVSNLPNLKRLYLSRCFGWSTDDTIKILERNHGIEEIVLHFCSYDCPSVLMLVECLSKQAKSTTTPRATVRLTIIDNVDYPTNLDKDLLERNSGLLQLCVKENRILYNDEKWEGDDYLPLESESIDSDDYDLFDDHMDSDYSYDDDDDMDDPDFDMPHFGFDAYGDEILEFVMYNM